MVLVLDASVFVAFATNEPVSKDLKKELKDQIIYPTTALTEAYPIILRKGVRKFKDKVAGRRILKENFELLRASFESIEISEDIATLAGRLSLKYWDKNISYMDCIVAALSITKHAKVLTLDSDFLEIDEINARVIKI